jgi:hypothetical protein
MNIVQIAIVEGEGRRHSCATRVQSKAALRARHCAMERRMRRNRFGVMPTVEVKNSIIFSSAASAHQSMLRVQALRQRA